MPLTEVQLIGAGGLGRELASVLEQTKELRVSGFWDDAYPAIQTVGRWKVLGNTTDLQHSNSGVPLLIALGNPEIRRKLYLQLESAGQRNWFSFVHPQALIVDPARVNLGPGTIILPFAFLSTDIVLGENVLVHTGSSLHHDTRVGSHSVLMPGSRITGGAELGPCCYLASNVALTKATRYPDGSRILQSEV